MNIFLLMFVLLRPVLFVLLFLTAFRDRLRMPLSCFVVLLAVVQIGFFLGIDAVYGQEDPAPLLYLNAIVNTILCIVSVRVPWDMALSCVLLVSPLILLTQSAAMMLGTLAPEGISPYLINCAALALIYAIVIYPATMLVGRVKNLAWVEYQGIINRRYFLLAMSLLMLAAVCLRDFSVVRNWNVLVGRALIFCVVFYIFYLCFSLVEKARANQELHNNLMVLERVRQAQEEYYHMLVANCESTQRLQHDIRHHGLAMKAYLDKGDYEGLSQYLNSYLEMLDTQLKPVMLCGNQVVDGITGYWQQRFQSEGLAYTGKIQLDRLYIKDMDMAIILGNLLENAFDAMMALADSQLEKPAVPLELKLVTKGNMLLLSVTNPCLDNIKETPQGYLSAKKDFTQPGIGLQNVQMVVDSYGGYFKAKHGEGNFQVQLMMKNDISQQPAQGGH